MPDTTTVHTITDNGTDDPWDMLADAEISYRAALVSGDPVSIGYARIRVTLARSAIVVGILTGELDIEGAR